MSEIEAKIAEERTNHLRLAQGLMEIAVWSGGAFSNDTLRRMSPQEVEMAGKVVNKFLAAKAKSMSF